MMTREQSRYMIMTILWMAVIFYFSSLPDLKSSLPSLEDYILRKAAHIIEFAILYFLVWKSQGGRKNDLATAGFITLLYALSDEFHQRFVHGRTGAPLDVGIDSIGIYAAYWWGKRNSHTN